MSYSNYGVHELQNADNGFLTALNPTVMVHAGTSESPDVIARHRARGAELHALLPLCVIGMRWWPDDNILLRLSDEYYAGKARPADWWTDSVTCDKIAAMYADRFFPLHVPGTILMVGNEDDPNNFACTVALHAAVCRLGTAHGIPLGLCCTSMGNPTAALYPLLRPLFDAMRDGRTWGIVHWWRPNTYSPLPLDLGLIQQHVTEAKKLGNFPPTFYGEFSFIQSVSAADQGPLAIGLSPDQFTQALLASALPVPAALYCEGDGIYGSGWKWFNLQRYHAALLSLPRTALTAYEQWKQASMSTPVVPQTTTLLGHARMVQPGVRLRNAPTTTADVVLTMPIAQPLNVYTTLPPVINQYTWYWGVTDGGQKGWFASPIGGLPTFGLDPVQEDVQLDLHLIYVSQLGNPQNNDCGQACSLSAAKTRLRNLAYGDIPLLTLPSLLSALLMPDTPTSIAALGNVLHGLGVPAVYSSSLTPDVIRSAVKNGAPVLVLINYVVFDPAQRFGHYALVVGLTKTGFVLNDPYQRGAGVQLSEAQLIVGLTDQRNKDGTSFASVPYQGYLLAIQ